MNITPVVNQKNTIVYRIWNTMNGFLAMKFIMICFQIIYRFCCVKKHDIKFTTTCTIFLNHMKNWTPDNLIHPKWKKAIFEVWTEELNLNTSVRVTSAVYVERFKTNFNNICSNIFNVAFHSISNFLMQLLLWN